MVKTNNELSGSREPTVLYDSDVQVTVKYDFGETFEREKFDGNSVGNVEWHNLVNPLCKLQCHNVFFSLLSFILYR